MFLPHLTAVTNDFKFPSLKWISEKFYNSFIPLPFTVMPISALAKIDKSSTLSAVKAVATMLSRYYSPAINKYLS